MGNGRGQIGKGKGDTKWTGMKWNEKIYTSISRPHSTPHTHTHTDTNFLPYIVLRSFNKQSTSTFFFFSNETTFLTMMNEMNERMTMMPRVQYGLGFGTEIGGGGMHLWRDEGMRGCLNEETLFSWVGEGETEAGELMMLPWRVWRELGGLLNSSSVEGEEVEHGGKGVDERGVKWNAGDEW